MSVNRDRESAEFIHDFTEKLGDMERLLVVAAKPSVVLRAAQHYVVAPVVGDDDGLAVRHDPVAPERRRNCRALPMYSTLIILNTRSYRIKSCPEPPRRP